MLFQSESTAAKSFENTRPLNSLDWNAKVSLKIETKKYIVSIADNSKDLYEALELRHQVFCEEFSELDQNLSAMDELDPYSDVLYVRDKKSNRIIASYRLIHSSLSPKFYSSSEFDLSPFLEEKGGKVELSRACVHADFRKGMILHLLWKGVAAYMAKTGARYLFGLTSIQTYDIKVILDIYRYLYSQGYVGSEYEIQPTLKHNLINWYGLSHYHEKSPLSDLPDETPSLLMSYLNAGAKVYGPPAIDHDFGCFDFFTLLDFEKLSKAHVKKYTS